MRNIAIITARSGSKGLKDKNIKILNGKPLLAYSIEAALASHMFDKVHVSTDSEEYAEVARQYGAEAPFLRSAENSSDMASSDSVIQEVLERYTLLGHSYDTMMLLQPTSPLRTAEDIRSAYKLMERRHAKTVVSVCEADHSPLWCNTLPEDGCMDGFCQPEDCVPRQMLKTYYRINGAIYLVLVSEFQKSGCFEYGRGCYAYIMPRERSVDIDGPMDFLIAETILKNPNYANGSC